MKEKRLKKGKEKRDISVEKKNKYEEIMNGEIQKKGE